MILAAPRGFALHFWNGKELHPWLRAGGSVLARYDASFQRDVRQIATKDPGR